MKCYTPHTKPTDLPKGVAMAMKQNMAILENTLRFDCHSRFLPMMMWNLTKRKLQETRRIPGCVRVSIQ
jgi:hypothetical protein